jgi:thiamine biosynthesis protein ThiC
MLQVRILEIAMSTDATLTSKGQAARAGLLALPDALDKLQQTNFYVAPELIRSLLEEDASHRKTARLEGPGK